MANDPPIIGLGEILWDLFPDGKMLGGAPFNFTFQSHQLGHRSVMVSRVGADDLGREIRARLAAARLSDEYVQSDPAHPTGTVQVALDAQGVPSFTITPEVAWDYLAWEERLAELLRQARAVCFGTLMQRHPVSHANVQRALREASSALVVYDVNLRQHFYTAEMIEASLAASRWVKLNDDELTVMRELLGLGGGNPSAILADLRKRYHLELACLTRGPHGCLVQTGVDEIDLAGIKVKVVDTVGAGDAFTAGLLVCTLEGRSLRDAAQFANRLAARVASSAGGTPIIDRRELEQ